MENRGFIYSKNVKMCRKYKLFVVKFMANFTTNTLINFAINIEINFII